MRREAEWCRSLPALLTEAEWDVAASYGPEVAAIRALGEMMGDEAAAVPLQRGVGAGGDPGDVAGRRGGGGVEPGHDAAARRVPLLRRECRRGRPRRPDRADRRAGNLCVVLRGRNLGDAGGRDRLDERAAARRRCGRFARRSRRGALPGLHRAQRAGHGLRLPPAGRVGDGVRYVGAARDAAGRDALLRRRRGQGRAVRDPARAGVPVRHRDGRLRPLGRDRHNERQRRLDHRALCRRDLVLFQRGRDGAPGVHDQHARRARGRRLRLLVERARALLRGAGRVRCAGSLRPGSGPCAARRRAGPRRAVHPRRGALHRYVHSL